MSARLAPSSRPLPSLFVAFLPFFVFPWPSPLRVINVIIIILLQGAPRGLPRPRPGSKRARRTLTLPRDAVDLVTARQSWDPGPWHDYANEDAHAFNCQALTATQWRNAPKLSTTMDSEGGTSTKQADFGPFDDANNYYGEQDCADAVNPKKDAFDDEGRDS